MAKREKKVIEHEPKQKPQLFTVEVIYKSGRTSAFDNVLATVTDHKGTPTNDAKPAVPYDNYMLVEQADKNSTYVNMDGVEELTIGVQNG